VIDCFSFVLSLFPFPFPFQGDYRSGKRIDMRKVIPYIASNFRKDKIWLRRTKPHSREYLVLLALDDSESVALAVCVFAPLHIYT
jgi:midasin (ATPase involved in ribosome maturation)